jgi:hypothetical protein
MGFNVRGRYVLSGGKIGFGRFRDFTRREERTFDNHCYACSVERDLQNVLTVSHTAEIAVTFLLDFSYVIVWKLRRVLFCDRLGRV